MKTEKKSRRVRHGSVYVLVLGTAMLVSLLTLATLTAQLIRHRQSVSLAATAQAIANAETGLHIGVQQLDADANWRTSFPHGIWMNQPTAKGAFELRGLDLSDGVLPNNPLDPLTLVAYGTFDGSTQQLKATILPSREPFDCLSVGICAGNDIVFNSAKLHYYGTIAANDTINSQGSSVIWADCEASKEVNGSGYQRATTDAAALRTLPAASEVISHYANLAESIDFSALPTQTSNLFRDPSFEAGIGLWEESWEASHAASLGINTTDSNTGDASLEITQRTSATDGPTYDLTHITKPDASYTVTCWLKLETAGQVRVGMHTLAEGVESSTYSDYSTVGSSWTEVSVTLTAPTWSGQLDYAKLRIETNPSDSEPSTDFLVDDASIIEVGTTNRLTHLVLGPDTNPFGNGSPDGVYVIDCQNEDLQIEHSRIVGTIVVRNPGNLVIGPGPVQWSATSPGYPALVVEGDVTISSQDRALSENKNATNLNPTAVPFSTLGSNSSESENYPSEFQGILFSSGDITISGDINFCNARIVAANDVILESKTRLTTLELAQEIGPQFFRYRYHIFNGSSE